MKTNRKLSFAILGGGGRGTFFSQWLAAHPEAGQVVAVAEPDVQRRDSIAKAHRISAERQFDSWEPLLEQPRLAYAVINTLMDRLHAPSALQALARGYHMMLEKPMAVTLEDCEAIDAARRKHKRIVGVCHSQRHHAVIREAKRLLDDGAIGRLVSFDHIEGVDPVHQSHSFVRGNWGNEGRSTFMLMSKSCHDVDLVAYVVGQPCRRVSSFGNLTHFRRQNMPAGAPPRCTDGCPVERTCPYAAPRIYVEPYPGWYADHAGMTGKSRAERLQTLRTGPYGRCVYRCDNDVVDHQVVSFEFAGPVTGTFTMTAFDVQGRRMRLHGTEGYIWADLVANTVDLTRFSDRVQERVILPRERGGHGGADDSLMSNFVEALRRNDPHHVLTGTAESLASHTIVFAAELARRQGRVVEIGELTRRCQASKPHGR